MTPTQALQNSDVAHAMEAECSARTRRIGAVVWMEMERLRISPTPRAYEL